MSKTTVAAFRILAAAHAVLDLGSDAGKPPAAAPGVPAAPPADTPGATGLSSDPVPSTEPAADEGPMPSRSSAAGQLPVAPEAASEGVSDGSAGGNAGGAIGSGAGAGGGGGANGGGGAGGQSVGRTSIAPVPPTPLSAPCEAPRDVVFGTTTSLESTHESTPESFLGIPEAVPGDDVGSGELSEGFSGHSDEAGGAVGDGAAGEAAEAGVQGEKLEEAVDAASEPASAAAEPASTGAKPASAAAGLASAASGPAAVQTWDAGAVRRRFRELSVLVHPDKCTQPGAIEVSQL